MKVFVVQRPTKTGWRNVAAYFKKGEARTHCVPNFSDRIVEGDLMHAIKVPKWHVGGKCKPAKSAKGKSKLSRSDRFRIGACTPKRKRGAK